MAVNTQKYEEVWGNKQEEGLHSSPNIICVNKSRHFRWVGHMAHNGIEETYILGFSGEA